jgi:hypothetical protein
VRSSGAGLVDGVDVAGVLWKGRAAGRSGAGAWAAGRAAPAGRGLGELDEVLRWASVVPAAAGVEDGAEGRIGNGDGAAAAWAAGAATEAAGVAGRCGRRNALRSPRAGADGSGVRGAAAAGVAVPRPSPDTAADGCGAPGTAAGAAGPAAAVV